MLDKAEIPAILTAGFGFDFTDVTTLSIQGKSFNSNVWLFNFSNSLFNLSCINEIVNKSSKPLNHNEYEIAGYRDALNKIHLEYKEMDFTEETILNLHEILMAYTAYEYAGKYKKNNNYIIEEDSEGNTAFYIVKTKEKEVLMFFSSNLKYLFRKLIVRMWLYIGV